MYMNSNCNCRCPSIDVKVNIDLDNCMCCNCTPGPNANTQTNNIQTNSSMPSDPFAYFNHHKHHKHDNPYDPHNHDNPYDPHSHGHHNPYDPDSHKHEFYEEIVELFESFLNKIDHSRLGHQKTRDLMNPSNNIDPMPQDNTYQNYTNPYDPNTYNLLAELLELLVELEHNQPNHQPHNQPNHHHHNRPHKRPHNKRRDLNSSVVNDHANDYTAYKQKLLDEFRQYLESLKQKQQKTQIHRPDTQQHKRDLIHDLLFSKNNRQSTNLDLLGLKNDEYPIINNSDTKSKPGCSPNCCCSIKHIDASVNIG